MSKRVVLAMDGSTRVSTAALLTPAARAWGRSGNDTFAGWEVLARRNDTDDRQQARVLLRLVDDMLRETGSAPTDIAAIVAGIGPGTFTGVRITVATARALALALCVPVVGVGTLSALAADAVLRFDRGSLGEGPLCVVPVVDARRGQVFYTVYQTKGTSGSDGAGNGGERRVFVRSRPAGVCDRDGLAAHVAGLSDRPARARTVIVGDVADLAATGPDGVGGVALLQLEVQAERLLAGQNRLEEPEGATQGTGLGPWIKDFLAPGPAGARASCRPGEAGSPEMVRPIYVRSPDADVHITKMRDPWATTGPDR